MIIDVHQLLVGEDGSMVKRNDFYKLMLVTQRKNKSISEYMQFIESCAKGGVTSVQLREKNASPDFLFEFGTALKKVLDPYHVPLIINDDLELAIKLNAGGVHLGQTDGDPVAARRILGDDKIIGVSIEAEEELDKANDMPVDYVAASAVFETKNKSNLKKFWGIDGVHNLSKKSRHVLMGIGGIDGSNISDVIDAGAKGVAVIGALHDVDDPRYESATLREKIDCRIVSPDRLQQLVSALREKQPVILSLTNAVTINYVANVLLAIGAKPVMSEDMSDAAELLKFTDAVNINMGMPNQEFVERAMDVAARAVDLKKPILLDPVGAGASNIRTRSSQEILEYASIVRGNASEIMALAKADIVTRGVETTQTVEDSKSYADGLAIQHNKCVIVSGAQDYVVAAGNGSVQNAGFSFGSPLMPFITGMGCALNGVVAAFSTVAHSHYEAGIAASLYYSLCAQSVKADKPGSFAPQFIDSLYAPDWAALRACHVK